MSDSNKSAGIAKLEGNELGWSNLVSFQRSLLDYASSKHTAVMESIKDGEDMKQMLTKKDLARFWDLAQNLPVTA